MAITPSNPYGMNMLDYLILDSTAVGRLRRQRKADCKPKKPKPVTDEQLLAIVDELEAKIKKQAVDLNELHASIRANYKLKMFAPIKHLAGFNIRGG